MITRLQTSVRKVSKHKKLLSLVDPIATKKNGKSFTNKLFHELQEDAIKLRESTKGYSKGEISEFKRQTEISYDHQLSRITEMLETRLREASKRLEQQLGEKQAARLEAEKRANEVQKRSSDEIKKVRKNLKNELETIKEEKTRDIHKEQDASLSVQMLVEQKIKLFADLECSKEEEEKSKKTIEGLASALHEVSSEGRKLKEKLLSQNDHENETQIEKVKLVIKATNKKYENMLNENMHEIDVLVSLVLDDLKAKRTKRSELFDALDPLKSEHKGFNTMFDDKRKEMEPLQQALEKLRSNDDGSARGSAICTYEKELNNMIYSLQYRIQHESISLNEENQLLKEIMLLEGTRDKVIVDHKQHGNSSGEQLVVLEDVNDSKSEDFDENSDSEIKELQRLVDQCLESNENSETNQAANRTRRIGNTVLSEFEAIGVSKNEKSLAGEHSHTYVVGDSTKKEKLNVTLSSELVNKMGETVRAKIKEAIGHNDAISKIDMEDLIARLKQECGGFNNAVIKIAILRVQELKQRGINCVVINEGKKGNTYFNQRDDIDVDKCIEGGGALSTAKQAQVIEDKFSLFVSEEVDKVELAYTKFVSLVKSDPVIQNMLPLSVKGECFDVKGKCVDAIEDEIFSLTSKDGKLAMERTNQRSKENLEQHKQALMDKEEMDTKLGGKVKEREKVFEQEKKFKEEIANMKFELHSFMSAEQKSLGLDIEDIEDGAATKVQAFEKELNIAKEKFHHFEEEFCSLKAAEKKIQGLQDELELAPKDVETYRNKLNTEKKEVLNLQERSSMVKTSLQERDNEVMTLLEERSQLRELESHIKIIMEEKAKMSDLIGVQDLGEKGFKLKGKNDEISLK